MSPSVGRTDRALVGRTLRARGRTEWAGGDAMATGVGPAASPSASRLAPAGANAVAGLTSSGLTGLTSERRASFPGGLDTCGLSISGASVAMESKMFPDILMGGSEGSESISKDQRYCYHPRLEGLWGDLLFFARKD